MAPHWPDNARASWASIHALFPSEVRAAFSDATSDPAPLFDEEASSVVRAVPARQREFAHGRECARAALKQLGYPALAVPVAEDRSPIWPPGVVGSVTHCTGFVGAVVARSEDLEAVGFDAEPAAALAADLVPLICTPAEVAWIQTAAPPASANWATVLFSAKEAVHKCIGPRAGIMLDFREVELTISPVDGSFATRLLAGAQPALPRFERVVGRFVTTQAFVATAAFIRPPKKSGG